jgi:hypothetical protein
MIQSRSEQRPRGDDGNTHDRYQRLIVQNEITNPTLVQCVCGRRCDVVFVIQFDVHGRVLVATFRLSGSLLSERGRIGGIWCTKSNAAVGDDVRREKAIAITVSDFVCSGFVSGNIVGCSRMPVKFMARLGDGSSNVTNVT